MGIGWRPEGPYEFRGCRVNVTSCRLAGLKLIQPKVYGDDRGWFLEAWNEDRYRECGIPQTFVQENLSYSRRGILRGMHFQNPRAQGKLVMVIQGEVMDVAVDLRRGSPTFRQWAGFRLDGATKQQLYVPPGFAHGFQVLSEEAYFLYRCSVAYSPDDQIYLRWDDPDLGIEWPLPDPVLSEKDANARLLREIPSDRLFA